MNNQQLITNFDLKIYIIGLELITHTVQLEWQRYYIGKADI
jgi:hypothetical protein